MAQGDNMAEEKPALKR